jgi:uncharacterized protein YbcC (UPF0753/DUF2309 family)
MTQINTVAPPLEDELAQAVDRALRAVPPAWPLTATVAVNPFLGRVDEAPEVTAARLARLAGARMFLPRAHYARKLAGGELTEADLAHALRSSPLAGRMDLAGLKSALEAEPAPFKPLPTIADLAAHASEKDWPALVADRIGVFAGGYFDEGQALWAASRRNGAYASWRAFATHDLTPEIAGLRGFGAFVADTPESPMAAIARALCRLGFGADPGSYLDQLLLTLGGWAQHARHLKWKAELAGMSDATGLELLAIRLVFEEALHDQYGAVIGDAWETVRTRHCEPLVPEKDLFIDSVLQLAAERAAQREIAERLSAPVVKPHASDARLSLQAVFCIDVRSEIFRRALESLDPTIGTFGFAGFFGLGASHRGFASDVFEHRLPVLIQPSVFTCSTVEAGSEGDRKARFTARAVRAWGRFKLAAVSSFAFVEAMGPVYATKLLRDGLGFGQPRRPDKAAPRFAPDLSLETRVDMAQTVLRAMSLTAGFARYVLVCGHGSSVVNNPYASALQCGACGGHAGDVNARLLAGLLNDTSVRNGLAARGIDIPADTLFLAGLHDTTTDRVTLFEQDLADGVDRGTLEQIRGWLDQAGQLASQERSLRLPGPSLGSMAMRGRDWAQVRPELGLAGCHSFIAAPRSRTAGRMLDGKAFLHDYAWRQDEGFKILEVILSAPVVVASWINLQYYGSVVAPRLFGAGNKLLHNVVGGIGVMEGNGGPLRAGLPRQSVHDGEKLLHEPLRLTVVIEAPKEAITAILRRNAPVRQLFDSGWLHLFAMDDEGRMAWRYCGGLGWSDAQLGPGGETLQAAG